jgi:RNA-directed DNA polymerase
LEVSLTTPPKIRSLQRKLYVKAKPEPAFRVYSLFDNIGRPDDRARVDRALECLP